ncbi:MAG TPA: hypothetical protein VK158_04060 [Acidobacteriota bacterium]|nr:hypothetical protein [Acidobacteriota bacterium]
MGWVQTFSSDDFVCFEQKTRQISTRIESRKNSDGWIIYKSYIGANGINYTEEYVAPTLEKMNQLIGALQKEKLPTVDELRARILEKSRRIAVQIEREYKEYGVEKWKFGVNGGAHINFALVRCSEEIDLDFVVHEKYQQIEQAIVKEIIDMLGFDGMEDVLNVNIYYFNKQVEKELEATGDSSIDMI